MRVEVRLLGRFSVAVEDRAVEDRAVEASAWPSRRSVQLVALLALAPHRQLTTEQVMDALWPDLAPEAARAQLHKTATLARQAMGSREAVELRGGMVRFWPGADAVVDAAVMEDEAAHALASGEAGRCAEVARRFAGELLPEERYEEWAAGPRERLRALHLELLRAGGQWEALVDADPTDEEAHRELMREHVRAGRLHAAIRQFQRARTILARELGVLPAPETAALYREILGTAGSGWVRPALVGREVELVRARATLRRALEGRPAAIFVTGPAGIGKTRLCEELVDQAVADGWLVMRAAARDQTASVPYSPLVEAVEATMVERPGVAESFGDADRALLSRLRGAFTEQAPGAVHRHAVLNLVSRLLAGAGASKAMLFLDDLHEADDDTLALAEVLASAPMPRGVLLLGAYRPDDPRAAEAARAMVARGVGVEVALGPLNRSEIEGMVVDVVDRPASASELELVWELSGGNPFFALEVAAALSTDQPAPASGAYGAVDGRLERLPTLTRAALRSVAVVAKEFTADELAALTGAAADRAVEHLDAAMAVGVVAHDGGSYRFRHDLIRDRLTRDVPPAERRSTHGSAADRLASLGAPPARVAHHLLAAGRDADAVPWLRRAAREATDLGAHADALALAEQALAVVPRQAELLAVRADALNGMGDAGAPAAYSLAMAWAPEPERAAIAVRRAKALVLAGDIPTALDTLAIVGDLPPEGQAQFLATRGLALWCAGALDEAEQAGQRAKELAEQHGSVRDFVDATMVLAMVAHERGAWPQRVALDLLDLQLRSDLAGVVIDAHLCVAESYLYGGVPYPEVIAFAQDLRAQGAGAGALRAEAFATTLLGEAHLLSGDPAAAASHLRVAAEQHRIVGVLCGEALSLQRLADAALAVGDDHEARAALSAALIAARGSPVATRHLLDRIHGTAIRTAGDPAADLEAVDGAARAVRGPAESCPPCSVNFTVPAAIACADAGEVERAAGYLSGAERVAGAFYPRGGWQAALDEARAHLALARGDAADAARLLATAAAAFERLGQGLDAARCRLGLEGLVTPGKV